MWFEPVRRGLNHAEDFKSCTAYYQELRKGTEYEYRKPNQPVGLRKLAKAVLGVNIQRGAHSAAEDAETTMKLYKTVRGVWELAARMKEYEFQICPLKEQRRGGGGGFKGFVFNLDEIPDIY